MVCHLLSSNTLTGGEKVGYKESRIKAGFSVQEVSQLLDVSPQAVYHWEAGESSPTASKLVKLAGLYCCSVDDLLKPDKGQDSA